MSEREEAFERMLADLKIRYENTLERMEKLRAEGKTKTSTFRTLMGDKLLLSNLLSIYKMYGLLDSEYRL